MANPLKITKQIFSDNRSNTRGESIMEEDNNNFQNNIVVISAAFIGIMAACAVFLFLTIFMLSVVPFNG